MPPSHPPPTSFEPVNLLVRGVNWLGDAVMSTPALQRLRERLPQSRISLLTNAKLADLWLRFPAVDRVVTFAPGDSPWSIARQLRRDGFDTALVFPNSLRSALEVWLAGVPTRIAYAGNGRSCFLTRALPYPRDRLRLRRRGAHEIKCLISAKPSPPRAETGVRSVHQLHDYLGLGQALGANPAALSPRLELGADEMQSALAECLPVPPDGNRPAFHTKSLWLGLNPSAAYGPAKCWPIERFAEVVRQVSEQVPNATWLCFGSAADWPLCQKLCELSGNHPLNLAGKTTLRQLMALLKSCRVLLTNDSGPMHVAAALGTPVVVPFGSTSPELTGPGLPGDSQHRLLRGTAPCAPCFRRTCPIDFRCMTSIAPEDVCRAVLAVLDCANFKA